jgi:hypothetical protein
MLERDREREKNLKIEHLHLQALTDRIILVLIAMANVEIVLSTW